MPIQNALFIGHGSPMNAVANNPYTQSLKRYAASIQKPDAIVVVSAHWQTEGTYITAASHPAQIYDFYGFPEELYRVAYTPAGKPELAKRMADELGIALDPVRGIDHAGWAVVKHLYPHADVPLLEISLDVGKTLSEHFKLGDMLRRYRQENILLIGSGNIIHNLRLSTFDENTPPFAWAVEMDQWFKEQIEMLDYDKLMDYQSYLPAHKKGIPTNEHYLPLLYTLGMVGPADHLHVLHESMQNGSISMRSYIVSD